MYIPSGKTGYYNLQGTEAPGIQWVVGNITFGLGQPGDDEMTGRIDWATYADLTDDTLFQFLNRAYLQKDFLMFANAAKQNKELTPFQYSCLDYLMIYVR